MVTDCFGPGFWDVTDAETVFVQGMVSVLKVVVPAAIALVLWRMFVARNQPPFQTLS
jgi:hypothetical protein